MMSRTLIFLLLLTGIGTVSLRASHNRAGQISIRQIGDCNDLTIEVTVTTYTRESSTQADRDSLTFVWGDGTEEVIGRNIGPGVPPQGISLGNDIKFNTYVATHTYPGRGTYRISMQDPKRNAGILNVNFPNSEGVDFYLETVYTFLNPQFQGCNDTPVLLQPPIDIGCVGQPFIHNPNAYDPDDDSLSYHLIVPLQDVGTPVSNYQFPTQIEAGIDNTLSINERTGDIVWQSPQLAGEYNLAMIIVSYRNGIPIDTTIRDMQITVEDCDNLPPVIDLPFEEICVVAGEVLDIPVVATAPEIEVDQLVELTALGGPFVQPFSPAEFDVADGFVAQPVEGRFRWATDCSHISDQFYSVVFRAVDNYLGDTIGLATLRTLRIKVVGPPPEDVQAEGGSGEITVTWESPYFCEGTPDDYFRGFSVWRRNISNQFPLDTCDPGLDGRGYERLVLDLLDRNGAGRFTYTDTEVERGRTYCYRVLGEFALQSPNGNNLYNRLQSLPSEEVCVELARDVPLLTNVDVRTTDTNAGSIEVRWTKPKATDLDTIQNPPPYRYRLLRADGIDGQNFTPVPGADFTYNSFAAANDTVILDTGLNTVERGYNYELEWYVAGEAEVFGTAQPASSVYLDIFSSDQINRLSWDERVPWDNFSYVVERFDAGAGQFVALDTVSVMTYDDLDVVNDTEYCYRIQSIGSYRVPDIPSPLINYSQERCGTPIDTVPPCAPELTVSNFCDDLDTFVPEDQFENELNWTNPNNRCEGRDDVAAYRVYFTPVEGGALELIETIEAAADTFYFHDPETGIAGCYAVTAVDSVGNESPLSNLVCVDNCPLYQLPNTFTPNQDGQNDLFVPYPYRFVDRVEFEVFNRWGNRVFTTSDPDLNWDGTNANDQPLAAGTYYYVCKVFERRVTGVTAADTVLSGYIELMR